jgi:hypothetical protein
MSINAIEPTAPSIQVTPLLAAMLAHNDQQPKNSLPTETYGTIQENAKPMPEVTLYNSHGILTKNKPNSLIAYA